MPDPKPPEGAAESLLRKWCTQFNGYEEALADLAALREKAANWESLCRQRDLYQNIDDDVSRYAAPRWAREALNTAYWLASDDDAPDDKAPYVEDEFIASVCSDAELGKHLREVWHLDNLAGERTLLDLMIKCNDALPDAEKWREQQAERAACLAFDRDGGAATDGLDGHASMKGNNLGYHDVADLYEDKPKGTDDGDD